MTPVPLEPARTWVIFIYGSFNIQGSGVDMILENRNNLVVEVSSRFKFLAANNQAEYKVLIAGITLVEEMRAEHIKLQIDSHVVILQVMGEAQD